MPALDRRTFLELLTALGISGAFKPAPADSSDSYRPGRIENEYSLFLPGEREALRAAPQVTRFEADTVTVRHADKLVRLRANDQVNGWRLLTLVPLEGIATAVFEKHVTHRGAIAYVTADGVRTIIPKQIGDLPRIRPRQTNTPHGVRLERPTHFGPDTVGQYILNSTEDPSYENIAALGAEYVGWTLVANEESAPQKSLYLEANGRSREINSDSAPRALWAPDATAAVFDPGELIFQTPSNGYHSKRTLLGGYLPAADLAVWDPRQEMGYEAIVLLPPGKDAEPMARLRALITRDFAEQLKTWAKDNPEIMEGLTLTEENGAIELERYWKSTPESFHIALLGLWDKWRAFHENAMSVEIPDEWLLNAARAGLTLSRCSYTGLDPTYQIGEGGYTKVPPSSHALFPVAHYEFIWAHQLWNQTASADIYFQHYLDHYIQPDGNFTYNTQDQVEAPLNVGVFLANSARGYFYTRNLGNFEKRLPVLERMLGYVLERYEYSKTTFPTNDRRHGLIWGSPEADLGDPKKDTPTDHPYVYQNAAGVWRGIEQHAKALKLAARDSGRKDLGEVAHGYAAVAEEMRTLIRASLAATLAASSLGMRQAGIAPFAPDDTHRDPAQLENYENHRFMEDWFLADWGDPALDLGHLKHRVLAGRQLLGLGTSHMPWITSNFMAHGTLSALVRQEDYRPFLLALYALTCYAADSGNRYAPEDAAMPGGHPQEGNGAFWSAVVNSTLQPTLGLRWLLCYEETDRDICHLQKAAPKHWYAKGERIAVENCPTRFGTISWSTQATGARQWKVTVGAPQEFYAELVIHIHPTDGQPLHATSVGTLSGNSVVLRRGSLGAGRELTIRVS
jgi:hypothetical protein